jgi:hypothetical protein
MKTWVEKAKIYGSVNFPSLYIDQIVLSSRAIDLEASSLKMNLYHAHGILNFTSDNLFR